jgi:shikimate dehydrogenase
VRVTSRTRVFAVLGDPVAHSLSPQMQNAGFQAAGLDAVYVALHPSAEELAGQVTALVRGGGGGNVTVPFKEIAARVPGAADARVAQLGAANVFAAGENGVRLGNTDVDGILAALDALHATADAWYLLGTGGSARAVVGAAAERGARVAVRSRDDARGLAFATWAASIGVQRAAPSECRVVINATPQGLAVADPHPLDVAGVSTETVALDLVYRHDGPTAWVRACCARGVAALDGREVLLAQGAASWRFWFPGVTPPVEVMRAALNGRLG